MLAKISFITLLLFFTTVVCNSFTDKISGTLHSGVDAVKEAEDKAAHTIHDVGEKAIHGAQDVGSKVVDGVKTGGEKAIHGAQEVGGIVVDGVKTGGEAVIHGAQAVGGMVADGVKNVEDKVIHGLIYAKDKLLHEIAEDYNILKERIHPSLRPTGPQALIAPRGPIASSLNYVQGFMDGMNATAAFEGIKACIDDPKDIWINIRNGTVHIGVWNTNEVKEGFSLLGASAESILSALRSCKSNAVSDSELDQLIKTFTSPVDFYFAEGRDINNTVFTINKANMIPETREIFHAAQLQDYRRLGFWVSTAMLKIFHQHNDEKVVVYKIEAIDGSEDGAATIFESLEYEEATRRYFMDRFNYQPSTVAQSGNGQTKSNDGGNKSPSDRG